MNTNNDQDFIDTTRRELDQASNWRIHIDDLCGELAMKKTKNSAREVDVVAREEVEALLLDLKRQLAQKDAEIERLSKIEKLVIARGPKNGVGKALKINELEKELAQARDDISFLKKCNDNQRHYFDENEKLREQLKREQECVDWYAEGFGVTCDDSTSVQISETSWMRMSGGKRARECQQRRSENEPKGI